MKPPSDKHDSGMKAGLSKTMFADLPIGDTFVATDYTDEQHASISTIKPGDSLSGRFEIKEQIGVGGMGVVYRALDHNRDEDIAIKVMLPGLLNNSSAIQRFRNEAKIAISLAHPHIVKTFDVNQDGNYLYLTMELLQGRSLRTEIERRKQAKQGWSVAEVITIADTVCQALSYAHKKTIHRDIKPDNIWLDEEDQAKLMDFGIAKLMSISQMTRTCTAMGTAYYMAPEQMLDARDVDHRADQYSVAVLIYELLTGRVPAGVIKSVHEVRRDVSKALSDIIMQALASLPEERFESCAAFAEQLRKAFSVNTVQKKAVQAEAPRSPVAPGGPTQSAQRSQPEAASSSTPSAPEYVANTAAQPTATTKKSKFSMLIVLGLGFFALVVAIVVIPALSLNAKKAKFSEVIMMMSAAKSAVELCASDLTTLKGCNGGKEGIPPDLGRVGKYVKSITTVNGLITAVSNEAVDPDTSYTFILTPSYSSIEGVKWSSSGNCKDAGLCM